jgi:hypothetical protein
LPNAARNSFVVHMFLSPAESTRKRNFENTRRSVAGVLVTCHLLCFFLDLPGGSSIPDPSAVNALLFFFAGEIKLILKSLFSLFIHAIAVFCAMIPPSRIKLS